MALVVRYAGQVMQQWRGGAKQIKGGNFRSFPPKVRIEVLEAGGQAVNDVPTTRVDNMQ